MFLELMKNNVLRSSEFSLLILFSLTESDHYRSSVYSMLLSQLLYEFQKSTFSWNLPIIKSVSSNMELGIPIISNIMSIVQNGYEEGGMALLHWSDYLLHITGLSCHCIAE